ncbi:glycosyltransferase [Uliginosibacterium aquaticum]|uniref:Glycosyltransferase n=1 Tax=Uliginosibacterium aquaticum TaxID=2731212 RepID=A0ABX2ID65_9RHOO|nr:glycosyltransferase [Uliginosibacterium aquaticum]NSL53668.1 glycosyltransferase [Uliginosibacterium aquaticum]
MPDAPVRHVLLAIDSLTGRGAEKVVVNLAEALVNMGHKASIVIFEDVVEFKLDPRVALYRLEPQLRGKWRFLSGLTDLENRRRFKALLARIEAKDGRVDLILSALPRIDRILTGLRDARIHHVIHNALSLQNGIRHAGWRKRFSRTRHLKRDYDRRQIIGVSAGVIEDLIEHCRVRPRATRTIYNPFNFDEIRTLAAQPAELPATDYILHVGAFTLKQKRQDLLLEAFAQADLPCKLVLLGKGKDEAKIRALIERFGLQDKVILGGFLANPYPVIRQARMLVLSSNYEGFGNVLVEALALGVPTIATDCPSGPAEILSQSFPEGLVPSGDAAALAERMRQFHDSPPTVRADATERFSAPHITREYLTLIRS